MKLFYAPAVFVGCLLLLSWDLQAQTTADSLWLNEIRVQATRVDVEDSFQSVSVQRIDSLQIQQLSATNLAAILQWLTPVYVRYAGPGGLATFSSRGFSSSQTQVIWNGFPINHAMLGVTDLTLIPSLAIQSVAVSAGASNASFGEKGGGTVAIETKESSSGVSATFSTSSFNTQEYTVEASTNFRTWNVGLLAGFRNADNNFSYTVKEFSNEAGGFIDVEKKRENNASESTTVLFNVGKKFNDQSISSKLWVMDSRNQIPGGISSQSNDALQEDRFLRWITRWKLDFGKHRVNASAYIANQALDYKVESANINSISTTQLQALDVSVNSSFSSNMQTIGAIQVSRNYVESSEYPSDVERTQISLNVQSIWMPVNNVFLYPGLRFDSYSDFGNAYTANLGANIEVLNDQIFLKSSISRNFTTPTFNDLYWPVLGNPNLEPETMLKAEASIEYRIVSTNARINTELTVYQAAVKDGIRWLPRGDGQSAPQNIESLDLRGMEFKLNTQFEFGDFNFQLGGSLNQALANISKARFESDQSLGKQLIYTPEWQYKANASVQFKSLSTAAYYAYVDERFTSSDHSSPFDPMPAYNTLDWVSNWAFNTVLGNHSIQFSIRNLLDEHYSVILDYPMQGTHYQLTFKTNFK